MQITRYVIYCDRRFFKDLFRLSVQHLGFHLGVSVAIDRRVNQLLECYTTGQGRLVNYSWNVIQNTTSLLIMYKLSSGSHAVVPTRCNLASTASPCFWHWLIVKLLYYKGVIYMPHADFFVLFSANDVGDLLLYFISFVPYRSLNNPLMADVKLYLPSYGQPSSSIRRQTVLLWMLCGKMRILLANTGGINLWLSTDAVSLFPRNIWKHEAHLKFLTTQPKVILTHLFFCP